MSSETQPEIAERVNERVAGRRWIIFVCAEPDGQNCVSGTHPFVCAHKCQALRDFHESRGPGPLTVQVEVEAVEP